MKNMIYLQFLHFPTNQTEHKQPLSLEYNEIIFKDTQLTIKANKPNPDYKIRKSIEKSIPFWDWWLPSLSHLDLVVGFF